jgi:dihydropteroate synthase
MGIVNVTPDSFSDGGALGSMQAVVDRVGQMMAEGADVVDVGGESTRPQAEPVDAAEELDRVLPVIEKVRGAFPSLPLSIDTYKSAVARAAIRAGADLVNDIWGCAHGLAAEERSAAGLPRSEMAETVAALRCPIILMHNRPNRDYQDFWEDFLGDLRFSLSLAQRAGIPKGQIWIDPGFGFAKNPEQNLEALKRLERGVALGFPVLLGTSRKSTIGLVLGAPVNDRQDGTAATLVWGIQQGCAMVRVHDVAAARRTIRMADAIKAGLAWKP